ncbi:MAG: efflux RND transporter permease subunit [Pirellulales bacterium]
MASFSRFFIDRPIFATVVSVVITLAGAIALVWLPIAQYPQITPPAIQVSIVYPGASAQVVADTVAAPIEQQVNGVEGMLYMSSQMGNDGSYSLTVTFDVDTDLNTALVMVQNRVALAMPILPTPVQNQGITIRKRTPDILLIVNLYSASGRYDDVYLSNYATINLRDELLRIDGASDVILFGQRDYSIRVWLDPQKMASYGLNAGDVAIAIRRENLDLPAGRIGQPPIGRGQPFDVPLDTLGRLATPDQFANIIVKVDQGLPPPTAAAAAAPAPMPFGLPVPGIASPLGTSSAVTGVSSLSNALRNPAATTLAPPVATPAAIGSSAGGGSTGGGATSSGGGTTAGAAGSGTVTSGMNATASGRTVADVNLSNQAAGAISGLSINTAGNAALANVAAGAPSVPAPRKPSASIVRLRNVGRVEMGSQNYRQAMTFDGYPSVGIAVFQLPGTNALDVAGRVREKMTELARRFPDGVDYQIAYDTTPFIRESVADVFKTLLEAAALVGLVVLVFLQNWRSVLIPMIAMPVAIVGTFAVMAAVNFSLNNISLFGLVLAIGIVVDDAIVVVENVERWLDKGVAPREATYRAMEEVTGPVIAVALVLCAVFVPCAFISGITGRFFRQFAVTIAASTVFSAVNSLTLSPALAAILLRPRAAARRDRLTRLVDLALGWFFRLFNAIFGASTSGYAWTVGRLLRVHVAVLAAYGVLLVLTYTTFRAAPRGFVPQQDQGRIIASVQLPDAASLQRTTAALARIDAITRKTKGVAHTVTVSGFSFVQSANGSNFASMFIVLDPFDERKDPALTDEAIMARLRPQWAREVRDAQVLAFGAPPIPGLSVAGGFKLMVEDRGALGLPILDQQTGQLVRRLQKQPSLVGVSTQFRSLTPQLYLDIDRAKVASLGIPLNDVNQTLQIYLGSLYVNSFNAFGRHWQVNVQAEGNFRNRVDDINLLQVRNNQGQMVLLGSLANVREIGGPIFVNRYNLYTAASISGNLRPGVSTGSVIASVDRLADQTLALSMNKEWTELMFMQIRAGNTAMYVFALAVACVFLTLAALYESWSLPLAVILVVPLCLLCSVLGVRYFGLKDNSVNIFVQIGLVVLVGLACKNSILIVEFAKRLRQQGQSRFEATREASRLRLRPILMTSFAFILGVLPLVVAGGAGAEMRRSLGTAVFSGMLGVTLFGIFLTPAFFYVIQGVSETRLFMAVATQWIGSVVLGALLGVGVGFALSRIGLVGSTSGLVVGGSVGIVAALLVQTVHWHAEGRPRP